MIRVVVDVNVLVSAILGPLGFSRRVLQAWEEARFTAISSAGIISKLEEKLSLDRIIRRYNVNTPEDILRVQAMLSTQTELVLVFHQERLSVSGDPEDDLVLATGRLGKADYLVTGDKGLLGLGQYEGTAIISPREFVEILRRANQA